VGHALADEPQRFPGDLLASITDALGRMTTYTIEPEGGRLLQMETADTEVQIWIRDDERPGDLLQRSVGEDHRYNYRYNRRLQRSCGGGDHT